MSETWLSWCTRRDGPMEKQDYWNVKGRRLDQILGEVKHSAVGSLAGTFGELDKLERQASWHFTVAKEGQVYQHYPLEAITWHCGKKGARNIPGNVSLIGIEHEGGAPGNLSEPLTPAQLTATIRLSSDFRRLCPKIGAQVPMTRLNLWEHRWLSTTACPSNRIPWDTIIVALTENNMTSDEIESRLQRIEEKLDHILGPGDNWIVDQVNGQIKRALQAAADAIKVPIEDE